MSHFLLRQFDDFARQVIDVSQINAKNIFERYQTMSRHLTAYGLESEASWPFVQMPQYEAEATVAIEATAAIYVLYTPIVEKYEIEQYEEFVASHRQWIQNGLNYHGGDTNMSSLTLIPKLYNALSENKTLEPTLPYHFPIAQVSPIQHFSFFVNGDVGTDPNVITALDIMNSTRNAVMSGIRTDLDLSATVEPASFLSTPVFESFANDAPVVAIFTGLLNWRRNFENLLPAGSKPLVLVVRNCDDAISYEVRGPEVAFLGYGDTFHDPKYDHLQRYGTFVPYASSTGCDLTLHIYPTAEFEAVYRSNAPAVKTIAILSCFLLTAILFVLFNMVVEYRQKRLESNATKNSALVKSLFPENVRERLVDEYDVPKQKAETLGGFEASRPPSDNGALVSRPPIADHFDSCTVIFADLVGCKCHASKSRQLALFLTIDVANSLAVTSWSSTREPEQVLTLLETLFNAFDKIALRMGVFKGT